MLIEERLEEILKIVNEEGSITVNKAANKLNVSIDTIRRDFIRLNNKGLVKRTHGGIVSKQNTIYEYGAKKETSSINNIENKIKIAKMASSLISDGDTIILDGGTTTYELSKCLNSFQELTLLTYGLNIACELSQNDSISTIIFGGIISNPAMAVLGPDAVEMIKHYRADKLFLAANAIDIEKGLMTPNRMQADIKKELIKIANEIIVVSDSSKFYKTALFSFCNFDVISKVVTDSRADSEFINSLKLKGIEVLLV